MKHNGALVAGPVITKLYRFRMAQIVSFFFVVALPTYGLPWETRIACPANICPPGPNSICQSTVFFSTLFSFDHRFSRKISLFVQLAFLTAYLCGALEKKVYYHRNERSFDRTGECCG